MTLPGYDEKETPFPGTRTAEYNFRALRKNRSPENLSGRPDSRIFSVLEFFEAAPRDIILELTASEGLVELEGELLLDPQHRVVSSPGGVSGNDIAVARQDFDQTRTAGVSARGVLLLFSQHVLQVFEIAVQTQEPAVRLGAQ